MPIFCPISAPHDHFTYNTHLTCTKAIVVVPGVALRQGAPHDHFTYNTHLTCTKAMEVTLLLSVFFKPRLKLKRVKWASRLILPTQFLDVRKNMVT
ncbi:hypothetical protein HanPSC8_Chr11g0485911 [Helianthus annuus]|nr:hypothetical protein HanPSC8_Chr11g0485911 [Helianthus annuus]